MVSGDGGVILLPTDNVIVSSVEVKYAKYKVIKAGVDVKFHTRRDQNCYCLMKNMKYEVLLKKWTWTSPLFS